MITAGSQVARRPWAHPFPSYELAGFPISPHQWSVVGSANIKEQSPSPSLTMAERDIAEIAFIHRELRYLRRALRIKATPEAVRRQTRDRVQRLRARRRAEASKGTGGRVRLAGELRSAVRRRRAGRRAAVIRAALDAHVRSWLDARCSAGLLNWAFYPEAQMGNGGRD